MSIKRNFFKNQRVAISVDVQNLFYSAKCQFHGKVDFEKLMYRCTLGRQLVRATAYVVETSEINQKSFFEKLSKYGYYIKTKSLKVRADGSSKGDWDMGIAIDAISLADKVDAFVLISGDGDYVDLINLLKSRGVFVEVHSFPKSTSDGLIRACNKYYPLDESVIYLDPKNRNADNSDVTVSPPVTPAQVPSREVPLQT